MAELLDIYYRNVPRDCDLIYLATNFDRVFDPSYAFSPADAYRGKSNRSGVVDTELYRRALELSMTQPGDVLSYSVKWVAFQERWAEVLPAIPIYSNIYYDFYVDNLRNYVISADQTWADSILRAHLVEPGEEDMIQQIVFDEPEEPDESELIVIL